MASRQPRCATDRIRYSDRVQMSFDIDPKLAKAAEEIANQIGAPVSSLVNEALRRTLPQMRPPAPGRVQGWLDDDDPFFRIMETIEAERHHRTPRDPFPLD